MTQLDWEHLFTRKYGKPPAFAESEQFRKYYGGNVYLTTEEHDRVIARQRSKSWKEASDLEKRRDSVLAVVEPAEDFMPHDESE